MSILVRALRDAPITTASSENLASLPKITVAKANVEPGTNNPGLKPSTSLTAFVSDKLDGGAGSNAYRILTASIQQRRQIQFSVHQAQSVGFSPVLKGRDAGF